MHFNTQNVPSPAYVIFLKYMYTCTCTCIFLIYMYIFSQISCYPCSAFLLRPKQFARNTCAGMLAYSVDYISEVKDTVHTGSHTNVRKIFLYNCEIK